MLLYKTLIQVLYAPTRYLFVKDPLAFRQEENVSTDHRPHRQALFLSFFKSPLRSVLRKGRVVFLTLSSNPGQLLFSSLLAGL